MTAALERKLNKTNGLSAYNKEFDNFISRGVIRKVSDVEIKVWKDEGKPINYISHHSVDRPDKATTKKRIVSNSSLANSGTGPSVNQLWPKGPNPL